MSKPGRRCHTCQQRKPSGLFVGHGRICAACIGERVPTRQLAAVLVRRARRREEGDKYGQARRRGKPFIEDVANEIGIPPREFTFWMWGARTSLEFGRADETLIRLGLLWFDVWNEDTVRRPALEVQRWRPRHRRFASGKEYGVRELVATRWYGDLGPDYGELERIRRAFEGDPLEAAA